MFIIKIPTLVSLPISSSSALSEISRPAGVSETHETCVGTQMSLQEALKQLSAIKKKKARLIFRPVAACTHCRSPH